MPPKRLRDLMPTRPRYHEQLPDPLRLRVMRLYERLSAVPFISKQEPTQWQERFCYSPDAEREIAVWEWLAGQYEKRTTGIDREESTPDVGDGLHEVAERRLGHGRKRCDGDLPSNNLHGAMFAAPGVPRKRSVSQACPGHHLWGRGTLATVMAGLHRDTTKCIEGTRCWCPQRGTVLPGSGSR